MSHIAAKSMTSVGAKSISGHSDIPRLNQLVIEAGHTERQYWRDLWRYRELFYFLAWRDLLVRYKQTVVGVGWSLIRPLLTMVVLTVVFGKLGQDAFRRTCRIRCWFSAACCPGSFFPPP